MLISAAYSNFSLDGRASTVTLSTSGEDEDSTVAIKYLFELLLKQAPKP